MSLNEILKPHEENENKCRAVRRVGVSAAGGGMCFIGSILENVIHKLSNFLHKLSTFLQITPNCSCEIHKLLKLAPIINISLDYNQLHPHIIIHINICINSVNNTYAFIYCKFGFKDEQRQMEMNIDEQNHITSS